MRKISAHYYLDHSGALQKYPIISIDNGVIVSIEMHTSLHEIAGLEFYSGIILPLFVDLFNPQEITENLVKYLSSPLIGEFILDVTTECIVIPDHLQSKIRTVSLESSDTEILKNTGTLTVVAKINWLVESGYFKTVIEGVNYFTSELSKRYFKSSREVAIGCKGEFLLYTDLLFIKGARFNELNIRRLL